MLEPLITKECAAELLSVSLRTINNWMSDGTLPPAQYIGRRAYWSPLLFQKWLDMRLGVTPEHAVQPTPHQALANCSALPKRRGRPPRSSRQNMDA
jgi:predicted DNA-binding transcriptional regulator AlpA